ncbi:MAG: hypothetical protein OHK0053_24980 [Microscillaceae bacterium]
MYFLISTFSVFLICIFNVSAQISQVKVVYHQKIAYKTGGKSTSDSAVLFATPAQALYIKNPQYKEVRTETKKVEEYGVNLEFKTLLKSEPYYKYLGERTVYQVFYEASAASSLVLKDPLPDFGWTITSKVRQIGGYDCVKAVSQTFRGRVYEAWFTYLIPISSGPWKLSGLPGLILEANDQQQEVFFYFKSLQASFKESVDYQYPKDLQLVNQDQFNQMVVEKFKALRKQQKAMFGEQASKANHTYNAIEIFPELIEALKSVE